MAIDIYPDYKYISGADAKTADRNAKAAEAAGNPTTARGTPIRKSNTEFDKNSFLKILSAQLSNQDPTQNQDSSAYVSQMAQFTAMEQMANLNTTMSDYAHQEMVGKEVILNEKDDKGAYITGTVSIVIRKSGNTYYDVRRKESCNV
jgi:flagellar basal-body rod modification protein FlgD